MLITHLRRLSLLVLCGVLAVAVAGVARADDEKPADKPAEKPAKKAPDKIERPMLWMVERTPPVFLFGSIHVPDERVTNLPPVVAAALDGADAVRTEIKMDMATLMKANAFMTQKGALESGNTLKAVVGDELYGRIEKCVSHPLLKMQLPTSRCWKAWMLVTQDMVLKKYGMAFPLDKQIWDRAAKAGKDVNGIEKVEEQLGVILDLTDDEQKQLLISTLDEVETMNKTGESPLDMILAAYLRGDANEIQKEVVKAGEGDALGKKLIDTLVVKRNKTMAARTLDWMAKHPDKSLMLVVGAGHMPGKDGIVDLMTKAGHKVTRLELKDGNKVKKAYAKKKEPATTGG